MGQGHRSLRWGALVGSIIAAALLVACGQADSGFASVLTGEWTATGADGEPETVRFDAETIHWQNKAQGEYPCPYRIRSHDAKARTIDINTRCRKRTGSDGPVDYQLQFSEDQRSFKLVLEGRTTSVFRSPE